MKPNFRIFTVEQTFKGKSTRKEKCKTTHHFRCAMDKRVAENYEKNELEVEKLFSHFTRIMRKKYTYILKVFGIYRAEVDYFSL